MRQIRTAYDEIEEKWQVLWKKYRNGIKSQKGKFAQRFASKRNLIDRLIVKIEQVCQVGVLYADLMLHDGFSTVRVNIYAKYVDGEESQVYKGAVKPSMTGFDCGGCYTFRYALDGKQYIADRVEPICG